MRRLLTPVLAQLIALPALTGCAAFTEDSTGGGAGADAVEVVAAFYPLQYAAERVLGSPVESLTSPGGEPHDLELGVGETALLTDADLVVVLSGFQPAVDASLEQNANGDVLDAADAVDLQPFAEHDHEATDEHDHAKDENDPHFWLDPLRMADLGDALATRLGELHPTEADVYAANAADLREDLEVLDTAYVEGLASCEVDAVVTNHDAFGYLEKYGLHLESIAGISPDAEPTPAALADLQDAIAEEGITTVFYESLVSPDTAETLARDAGLDTAVLDTVEGLTDATAGEDYLSLMRANLDALREANRC